MSIVENIKKKEEVSILMKSRMGFISNSSSSSFILRKDDFYDQADYSDANNSILLGMWQSYGVLPKNYSFIKDSDDMVEEIEKIKEAIEANSYPEMGYIDSWRFEEYKGYFLFHTELDNFDLLGYLYENYGIGRIKPIVNIPPHSGFCGNDSDDPDGGINSLKRIIDVAFSKGEGNRYRQMNKTLDKITNRLESMQESELEEFLKERYKACEYLLE